MLVTVVLAIQAGWADKRAAAAGRSLPQAPRARIHSTSVWLSRLLDLVAPGSHEYFRKPGTQNVTCNSRILPGATGISLPGKSTQRILAAVASRLRGRCVKRVEARSAQSRPRWLGGSVIEDQRTHAPAPPGVADPGGTARQTRHRHKQIVRDGENRHERPERDIERRPHHKIGGTTNLQFSWARRAIFAGSARQEAGWR